MKRYALGLVFLGLIAAYTALTGVHPPSDTVYTVRGDAVSMTSFPRPVAFNFFAPWCPPCRREIPLLLQKAEERNLVFVGVQEARGRVFQFGRAMGIPEHRLFYGGFGGPVSLYQIRALPTTLVFCSETAPPKSVVGEITPERLSELSCP